MPNLDTTQGFSDVKLKRQTLDHYIKGICFITPYNGILTIENLRSQPDQTPYQLQTEDIEVKF